MKEKESSAPTARQIFAERKQKLKKTLKIIGISFASLFFAFLALSALGTYFELKNEGRPSDVERFKPGTGQVLTKAEVESAIASGNGLSDKKRDPNEFWVRDGEREFLVSVLGDAGKHIALDLCVKTGTSVACHAHTVVEDLSSKNNKCYGYEGYRFSASASRFETAGQTELPGALVSAPDVGCDRHFEFSAIVPQGADRLNVDYE